MRKIFSLSTVLALAAAPVFGAQPLGGLAVYGTVWSNQAALPSGSYVFAGDVVETDSDAMAVLASAELGRVELRSDSRAAFGATELSLERGAAASAGLPIRMDAVTVRPETSATDNWFVVAERDGERVVSAYRGDAVIEDDGRRIVVPEGSFALAAALPTPKQAGADNDGSSPAKNQPRRRTGRASNSSAKSGWSLGKLGTTASTVVVTGAAAAAATGLAVGLRDESASPAN